MYKKVLLSVLMQVLFILSGFASDTTKSEFLRKLNFKAEHGIALKTNDFIKSEGFRQGYEAYSLKYTLQPKHNDWLNYINHDSYNGVGLYFANLREKRMGYPFSIFLVQGARLARLHNRFTLNYEFNLGYSANWKTYNAFSNQDNITIGTSENIHIGGAVFFDWAMSRRFNLRLGAGVTHFSNGASRMPNKGLNLAAGFLEVNYKLNEDGYPKTPETKPVAPPLRKRIDHEFLVTFSSRQVYYSTTNTGLPTQYLNQKYRVLETSYSPMFVNRHKYKWGPSLNILYDESSGSYARREQNELDGFWYDRVIKGDMKERFGVGIGLKGEITLPYVSYFANLGYNVIHGNERDSRFYQILGVKADIVSNIFGTFGIRATRFSKAQFIYWSLGYALPVYRKEKPKA
jgi:hypothetical protein